MEETKKCRLRRADHGRRVMPHSSASNKFGGTTESPVPYSFANIPAKGSASVDTRQGFNFLRRDSRNSPPLLIHAADVTQHQKHLQQIAQAGGNLLEASDGPMNAGPLIPAMLPLIGETVNFEAISKKLRTSARGKSTVKIGPAGSARSSVNFGRIRPR